MKKLESNPHEKRWLALINWMKKEGYTIQYLTEGTYEFKFKTNLQLPSKIKQAIVNFAKYYSATIFINAKSQTDELYLHLVEYKAVEDVDPIDPKTLGGDGLAMMYGLEA